MSPNETRRALLMLWALVTIGVVIAVGVPGFMGWALWDLRAQRVQQFEDEKRQTLSDGALGQQVMEVRDEIGFLLDENKPLSLHSARHSIERLRVGIRAFADKQPRTEGPRILSGIEAMAEALADLWKRARIWRDRYEIVSREFEVDGTLDRVRKRLTGMQETLAIYEGRGRIHQAILINRYRRAEPEDATRMAHTIVKQHIAHTKDAMGNFKTELGEIGRLVEILGAEEHFDRLVDLKDNLLKPSLDRLERTRGGLLTSKAAPPLNSEDIEALKTALFGEGYRIDKSHQTIFTGGGGLYDWRRDLLRLRIDQANLNNELFDIFAGMEIERNAFANLVRQKATTLATQMELKLETGWSRLLTYSGLSILAFVILAWFVSREMRTQIDTLDTLRRRNELVLNSAGEGILGLDEDGRTTFLNPAVTKITGWKAEELLGELQHSILYHSRADGSPMPREECPILATVNDGMAHRADTEVFWRKDGSSFPVEYVSTPTLNNEGLPDGAVVTFQDISERRSAEQEQHLHLRDLERFNDLAVGRELRMIDLKREVNGLLSELGRQSEYRPEDPAKPRMKSVDGGGGS
ncbi:MAG: PAS domain S-box protein [Gammaproteobacteria bacterium]|nr:PAS domain S-box protein [Gammaproteobacteria bacterium]